MSHIDDLAERIYFEWLKTAKNLDSSSQEERVALFDKVAGFAYESAAALHRVRVSRQPTLPDDL